MYRSLSLSPRPCRPFLPSIEASCPVRVLLHTRVLYLALPLEPRPPPLSVRMSIAQIRYLDLPPAILLPAVIPNTHDSLLLG